MMHIKYKYIKQKNLETPKFRFELDESHYYTSGGKIFYGRIVNRRIVCEESNSKKEYNEVYDFAVDDEDAKYYDKQNISFKDIFENMEDCFKYVISTVNYLYEQQCEVMDRINTINT